MANIPGIIFFETITPVHMGAGSSLSHIDLPIQRDRTTNFPIFQSSGIKGALRAWASETEKCAAKDINTIFGPEPQSPEDESRAGALAITDACVLLLSVASEPGVFSFVTCNLALNDFFNKLMSTGLIKEGKNLPEAKETEILVTNSYPGKGKHWLMDLPFDVKTDKDLTKLARLLGRFIFTGQSASALHKRLQQYLVLVHDEVFKDLCIQATEVRNRIRINPDTGVVQEGALWTEEFVPCHSVFYSLTFFSDRYQSLPPEQGYKILSQQIFSNGICQMGGDQTLGHGWVRVNLYLEKDFPSQQ